MQNNNNPSPYTQVNGTVVCPPPGTLATYSQGLNSEIQTQFTMQLDQSALISIAVAEAEKQIRAKVSALQKQVTAQNTQLTQLVRQRDDFLREWTQERLRNDRRITALLDAVEPFLGRRPIPSFSSASYDRASDSLSGTIAFNERSAFTLNFEYEEQAPPTFANLLTSITNAERTLDDLKREVLGARSALNNVDALERGARARMAAEVAKHTVGGEALVKSILETIDADSLIDSLRV
jgi:hypothetical protein